MLLRNGLLVDSWTAPAAIAPADLRITGGRIAAIGPDLALEVGEEQLELGGALVAPGFVCGHTHLYSVLSRGMPPTDPVPPRGFLEILQKVWWKLDKQLDEASLRASARIGVLEALRCGTTGLIDHHASPAFVAGSLDLIATTCEELGIRALLCYETSDRDGPEVRDAGIAENLRFAGKNRPGALVTGMIGGHASFTCGEQTLDRLARACEETGTGLHIHVAEGGTDRALTLTDHGVFLERFARRGLLTEQAILAHCVDLRADEIRLLDDFGVRLAHNPTSNMNNRVGVRPAWAASPDTTLLGTDGIGADMYREAQTAFFRGTEADPSCSPAAILGMLAHNAARLSPAEPHAGTLRLGAPADLQVLDYPCPTELHGGNLGGHFIFGMSAARVRSTLVAGRLVYDAGRFPGVDLEREYALAREQASALWRRMAG